MEQKRVRPGQRMQHEQAEMITVDVARGGGLLLVST
jgi:hypothetical protein